MRKKPSHEHNTKNYIYEIIDKYDFEDAALIYFYFINQSIPSNDEFSYYMHVKQLVREEFDAAYKAGGYAKDFVEKTCQEGVSWFDGAMQENAEYKIDERGGPQQILLNTSIALMNRDAYLAVKMRCEITKIFYEDYELYNKSQFSFGLEPGSIEFRYNMNRHHRFERLKVLLSTLHDVLK